jgi:uncharacterized protein YbjT (DUF2867 family)
MSIRSEPAGTRAEEVSSAPLVLVTGASGFVGSRVVARLLAGGYRVRALVRSESTSRLRGLSGVSLEVGDVRDPEAVARAVADVQWVVHAAADTTGTLEGGRETTIQGTRNVLEAARSAGTRRVAYVSSCSVYRYVGVPDGTVLQETSPLEPRPERRGPYSWAKTVADQEVERMAEALGVDVVRLRPGLVYGPGGDPANPMVGLTLGGRLFLTIRRADRAGSRTPGGGWPDLQRRRSRACLEGGVRRVGGSPGPPTEGLHRYAVWGAVRRGRPGGGTGEDMPRTPPADPIPPLFVAESGHHQRSSARGGRGVAADPEHG